MAIRLKARSGETAEQLLRRFKKLCEKEGLIKEVKRRAYYEKPSERKRREVRKGPRRSRFDSAGPSSGPSSGPSGPGGSRDRDRESGPGSRF